MRTFCAIQLDLAFQTVSDNLIREQVAEEPSLEQQDQEQAHDSAHVLQTDLVPRDETGDEIRGNRPISGCSQDHNPHSLHSTTLVDVVKRRPSRTIHRVRSNTVLATITTVIKMEEGGGGDQRPSRRPASADSNMATFNVQSHRPKGPTGRHGAGAPTGLDEARSRVSLVPDHDALLDLSVVPVEETEDHFLSAGEGEMDTDDTTMPGGHSDGMVMDPIGQKGKQAIKALSN